MNKLEDLHSLLERIANDDSRAFRIFYDKCYIQIYRFTSYFVRNEETKEEIVSDVFFSVWQNRKKLMEIDDITAYLYITTRNRTLYYINKSHDSVEVAIDSLPFGIVSHESTPEEELINEELKATINSAINELPERCKLIFLMAKEENLKYREIAEILSISEKTVNAQIVIAIKKLTVTLQKHMHLFFHFI